MAYSHKAARAKTIDTDRQPGSESDSKVGDYELDSLVKAPVEPPRPDVNEGPEETSNKKVTLLFIIGMLIAAFGLLILFVWVPLGLAMLLIAGLVIIFGVFAPVK